MCCTESSHRVVYEYNEDNNVSSITETVNGTTKTYSYTYDDDNRLISENADGITVTYTYDDFGRLTQKQTKNGDTVIKTDSYTFTASTVGTNGTSSQVASYNGLSYTYDDNGNILSVSDGTNTTSYVYDSANQLVRENNQALGFTKVWTYDNAGNILSRSEYAYTTGDLGTATDTVTYAYTSSKWGDMLRVYDGQNLTYDASGNLANDGKYTYTWEHGRQLARITAANGAQMLMTYGADGLRTGRVKTNSSGATLATYTYVYDGGKLSQMTYGNYVVDITYDAAGTPLTMVINGQTTYHYVTNLQGDVIALTDDTDAEVITYSYDAWGNVISYTGTYATLNPLLYRGYVYDFETGLYYLQSRYYNPEWGRFINGDGLVTTGQGVLSYNMYAYCSNNPVMGYDPTGEINAWGVLVGIGLGVLAVGAAALTVVTAGAASPLVATAGVAIGTFATAALTEASIVTAYGAIKEEPVVYDVTVVNGNDRVGASLVYDYGENTSDLYAHTGAQTNIEYGATIGTGIVMNYDEPGDYGGEFVDISVSGKFKGVSLGADYCTSPANFSNGYTDSHAVIFTTGWIFSPFPNKRPTVGYDYYWQIN